MATSLSLLKRVGPFAIAVVCQTWAPNAGAQSRCLGDAEALADVRPTRRSEASDETGATLQARIAALLARTSGAPAEAALTDCTVAELLKRTGDPSAEQFYRRAITADPGNPEYHLLFGDYLRNYRGPGRPLFSQAEHEYLAALRALPVERRSCERSELACRIIRSRLALHERDGLELYSAGTAARAPRMYLSTQFKVGGSPLGEGGDDVRALTNEALFASSPDRLGRFLTPDEARSVVRLRQELQVVGRLRVRYGSWPMAELSIEKRSLADAQITRFDQPKGFNDILLESASVALETPLGAYPLFDVLLRGEVRRGRREGLIEFLPDSLEDVRSVGGTVLLSRFIGPDKVNLEFTYGSDNIQQQIDRPLRRRLTLTAPSVRYQIFRGSSYERRIAARSSELFAGTAKAVDVFGPVDLVRTDVFAGLVLRQIPGILQGQSLDVTVQPTWYSSDRRGTDSTGRPIAPLRNAQVRTNFLVDYRVVDRENETDIRLLRGGLVFLHIFVLGSFDRARTGLSDFMSSRAGVGLAAKLVTRRFDGGTSFLLSTKYETQHFSRLDRTQGALHISLGMGF